MNESNIIGKIHSIETCGTVDGPGLRFVAFLQGCSLQCVYCHNPDTWDMRLKSQKFTPEEFLSEVIKYKPFIKNGGITLSGGEPCLQPKFVKEVFKLAKKDKLHTALDTSGHVLNDDVKEALKYTNLVLLDIKSINPEKFKYITKVKIEKTLKFLDYLRDNNIKVWIRHVLVPTITDDDKDLQELADFIAKYDNIERIDILPYHRHGEHKWQSVGKEYPIKEIEEPTADRIQNAKDILASSGKVVR